MSESTPSKQIVDLTVLLVSRYDQPMTREFAQEIVRRTQQVMTDSYMLGHCDGLEQAAETHHRMSIASEN